MRTNRRKLWVCYHLLKKIPNWELNFCTMKCVKKEHCLKHALCKIPKFHLISRFGNFLKRHSFRRGSGESPRTLGETVPFHKISTPVNSVKFRYFTQWCPKPAPSQYNFRNEYGNNIDTITTLFVVNYFCENLHLRCFHRVLDTALPEPIHSCIQSGKD